MNTMSRRADAGIRDRSDRLHPWTAALLTALLHALLVLLVLLSAPVTLTTPQGAAGGALQVTYIDETLRPPPPTRAPSPDTAAPSAPAPALPAATRLRSTPVAQADDPVPPDVADTSDRPTPPRASEPAQPDQADARRNPMWGQPPGMLPDAPVHASARPAPSPASNRGRRNHATRGEPNMEVDGYQVYYDLVSETRLRAWRDQGMTELFLPLPGTRRLMVCPLEIALNRDSGACRMVEPDAPELQAIGDARDVIHMQRVYKLGQVVWRGPGPYR